MGNHAAGNAMGKQAMLLATARRPGMTALQLLDLICEPFRGCDAEFESEDPNRQGHVHPDFPEWRSPHRDAALGMLMLEAFAPNGVADLDRYAEMSEDAGEAWWDDVVVPFRQSYDFC